MKRVVLPLVALLVLLGLQAPLPPVAAQAAPVAGQSLYVPLEPVRLLDTRAGRGAPVGRVGPGVFRDVVVTGVGGVPAAATAVVLNVIATQATAGSYVRVYPSPAVTAAPPLVSSLHVVRVAPVATLVTVRVGAGGRVRLLNAVGEVHLIADVTGFFSPAAVNGSSLEGRTPVRLLDTRRTGGPLQAGEVRHLRVVGPGLLPAGTTAVVLNVTGVGATVKTDVRVYPTRTGPPPPLSTFYPAPGGSTAAAVVVRVGDGGTVSLRNTAGSVHLVVDLSARYVTGRTASVFSPVAPHRILDTRATRTPLGPGGVRDLVVAGTGVVPSPGTVVALQVTAISPTTGSYVTAYPHSATVPGTSNLHAVPGQTVTNAVMATVGRNGVVRLRNAFGSLHLVVDLAGWFGPPGDGWDISWPQCTAAGATTTRHPSGGAFAVVGLTGARPTGRPFVPNSCFAAQWAWANTLRGEPAVYLNLNAPGPRSTVDGQRWRQLCGTGTPTSACGRAYGVAVARYALARLPAVTRHGGRPMVWMDVEGPYEPNGPFWQSGYAGAVAVNRAVLNGAVETLGAAGYRVGIYSDRGTSPANDWLTIMGAYRLVQRQNWVFRAPTADGSTLCTPANSFSGGPVVMVQIQPGQSGQPYDVDHLC